MENDPNSRFSILLNMIKEQEIALNDPDLRGEMLELNVQMNKLMEETLEGKKQLVNSTLTSLDTINQNGENLADFITVQHDIKEKALKNEKLKDKLLIQNVNAHFLALHNKETAQKTKEFSIETTQSILNDPELQKEFLNMQVDAFLAISKDPELVSKMANALIPLLKDPKIKSELEKMIKMVVAKELKKMESKMQAQMQQLLAQQMQQIQTQMQQMETQMQEMQNTKIKSNQPPVKEEPSLPEGENSDPN